MRTFKSAASGIFMAISAFCLALTALGAVATHNSVRAAIITVDPDSFADGTDISNAFAGIALSVTGASGPVFSRTDGAASTGSHTFGNTAAGGALPQLVWFEGPGFDSSAGPVLRVDFGVNTDFVAIDIMNQDTFDGGVLRAFNSSDVEIATDSSIVTGIFGAAPGPQVLSVSLLSADIAYVTIAGQSAQDSVHLDNLQYNQIVVLSESGMALLLAISVAGFFYTRRHLR